MRSQWLTVIQKAPALLPGLPQPGTSAPYKQQQKQPKEHQNHDSMMIITSSITITMSEIDRSHRYLLIKADDPQNRNHHLHLPQPSSKPFASSAPLTHSFRKKFPTPDHHHDIITIISSIVPAVKFVGITHLTNILTASILVMLKNWLSPSAGHAYQHQQSAS